MHIADTGLKIYITHSHEIRVHNSSSIWFWTHLASSSLMGGSQCEVAYVAFPVTFRIKWKRPATW